MHYRILTLTLVLLIQTLTVYSDSTTDSLLDELDLAIGKTDSYINQKQSRITGLKEELNRDGITLPQQYIICQKLYDEYKSFKYDSAFHYALKLQGYAQVLKDSEKIDYSRLKISFTLLSSGIHREALDALHKVNTASLPLNLKREYYELMSRAYYELASAIYDNHYTPNYTKTGTLYADSVLLSCEKNSMQYFYLNGLKNFKLGNYDLAKKDFQFILNEFNLSHHEYAIVVSTYASAYKFNNEPEAAIDLMIKAALADIKSSTKETLALTILAEMLYVKGDIDKAYSYIQQSMKDADFYGARQRKVHAAYFLQIIEGAQVAKLEQQKIALFNYSLLTSLLTLLSVISIFIIVKQLRRIRKAESLVTKMNNNLQEVNGQLNGANEKLKEANEKLRITNDTICETNNKLMEANTIKEEYIGYSFNMYNAYIEKLQELKNAIQRKLRFKKYDEVNDVLDSINLKKEREALYTSFDSIFLKLFPDFVQEFNSLFPEEERMDLSGIEMLNTELRIFALIRMGVNDHEQIARILEYSVRTIYNYKTKVKNKSIYSNEDFEQRVLGIKVF